jgi:hypothetical protein
MYCSWRKEVTDESSCLFSTTMLLDGMLLDGTFVARWHVSCSIDSNTTKAERGIRKSLPLGVDDLFPF